MTEKMNLSDEVAFRAASAVCEVVTTAVRDGEHDEEKLKSLAIAAAKAIGAGVTELSLGGVSADCA